ncbi:hypothetical protein A2Z67_02555 [Candidatus Woesebacteria bacterium RBG_13_36_22]|uniref:Uncharacterized protein n=1 Tax=Candidatus Woesebacteria bacterium RBG_13_36_22 TaxID=1802478 RepID=A0A1F7X1B0_9BACT|nr:MAG: hypothetical protein A2Z67_02555 [Candidatus Woesebacteria bacterium RBG_13_36_22]
MNLSEEKENMVVARKVELIPWPESQGCIGCQFAALVHQSETIGSSTYICLAKDKSKVSCDNPDSINLRNTSF